jgi:hypothetical protein
MIIGAQPLSNFQYPGMFHDTSMCWTSFHASAAENAVFSCGCHLGVDCDGIGWTDVCTCDTEDAVIVPCTG